MQSGSRPLSSILFISTSGLSSLHVKPPTDANVYSLFPDNQDSDTKAVNIGPYSLSGGYVLN